MNWDDLKSAKGIEIAGFRLEAPIDDSRMHALRLNDRSTAEFIRVRVDPVLDGAPPTQNHPRLQPILAWGSLDDTWGYVFVGPLNARTLDDLLEEGPIEPGRATRLLHSIQRALVVLHDNHVALLHLRTADVHLATDWEDDDDVLIPAHPILLGPSIGRRLGGYCAPELAADAGDTRSDQYSLGVILFEMLTGMTPHNPDAPPGERTVTPLLPHPQVPAALETILTTLMSLDMRSRFADDAMLLRALDRAGHELEPDRRMAYTPMISRARSRQPTESGTPAPPSDRDQADDVDNILGGLVLLLICFLVVLTVATSLFLSW